MAGPDVTVMQIAPRRLARRRNEYRTIRLRMNHPAPSCAAKSAADFRFSDARKITDRDFDDAKALNRAFQNHFDGPAVGGLLEGEGAQSFRAGGAERAEIGDAHAVQNSDQLRGEPVAEGLVPRQRAGLRWPTRREPSVMSARPSRIGASRDREFGGAVTVVAIEKYDDVGIR